MDSCAYRATARAVGQRAVRTGAAVFRAAGAAPAAFRIAGFGFEHGLAFSRDAAAAFRVGSEPARLALAIVPADPVLIRTLVEVRIEIGRG